MVVDAGEPRLMEGNRDLSPVVRCHRLVKHNVITVSSRAAPAQPRGPAARWRAAPRAAARAPAARAPAQPSGNYHIPYLT